MFIVDTGVLVALADRRDSHHRACVHWLLSVGRPLVVPPMVLAEACYLVQRHLGTEAEAMMVASIGPGRRFDLGELMADDLDRIADLVRQYSGLRLGGTDASIIATAERLGVTDIATVDRRHFTVVRPRHAAAFTLWPTVRRGRVRPPAGRTPDHGIRRGIRNDVLPGRGVTRDL